MMSTDLQTIPLDELVTSLRDQIKDMPDDLILTKLILSTLINRFDDAIILLDSQYHVLKELKKVIDATLTDFQFDQGQSVVTMRRALFVIEGVIDDYEGKIRRKQER
jgi:hypothetical protein